MFRINSHPEVHPEPVHTNTREPGANESGCPPKASPVSVIPPETTGFSATSRTGQPTGMASHFISSGPPTRVSLQGDSTTYYVKDGSKASVPQTLYTRDPQTGVLKHTSKQVVSDGTGRWKAVDGLKGGGNTEDDAGSDSGYKTPPEQMPTPAITPQERTRLENRELNYYPNNSIKAGTYNRINTFKYPIRNIWDVPLYVKSIDPTDITGEFSSTPVKPYIDPNLTPDQAKALYDDKAYYRVFTKNDVKKPGEEGLIGQGMVVANRRIKKGEVIGVYGGRQLPNVGLAQQNDPFILSSGGTSMFKFASGSHKISYISGDNLMSRINTNFEYDAKGIPISQSPDGYNVARQEFNVRTVHGNSTDPNDQGSPNVITVIYATTDIPAGTEFRLNYGYTDRQIAALFSKKSAQ